MQNIVGNSGQGRAPSRRAFLKTSGLAALGASVHATLQSQSPGPRSNKLRVGIVGGRFGNNFLVHEFVDSLVKGRRPAIDIYEALAYTLPGILAYGSALRGGERLGIPQFER